jgi:hypothetical protein
MFCCAAETAGSQLRVAAMVVVAVLVVLAL